jgi:predicted lipoprotein with Yx(FWY)xxD motif
MKRLFTGAAAPIFLTALLLAGCGSSSSSSSPSAASSAGSSSQGHNSTAAPAVGKPVTVTTKHNKFGTVLAAGSKQRTVYLFEADKRDKSNCASACASGWPPVIGMPKAKGDAKSMDLSTITRASGKPQVTYKGHPLYYFVRDKDAGDTYGQNVEAFGAEWYVLSPTGSKIDEDTGKSTGS